MAFKIENVFFAVFILILVMTFGVDFIGKTMSTYNVVGDTSKMGVVSNTLKNAYDPELDMKNKIQGDIVSADNSVNDMVKAGYTTVRNNPFTMTSMALNATGTIVMESGLIDNSVFFFVLSSMLVVAVIFAIIYLIMRFRVY